MQKLRSTRKGNRLMEANDKYATLYEDEDYLAFSDEEAETVTLVMSGRGVSLIFASEEWTELKKIASGIELPGTLLAHTRTLYEDDIDLFMTDGEVVEWNNEVRMFTVGWHIEGWERFKQMMMRVERA